MHIYCCKCPLASTATCKQCSFPSRDVVTCVCTCVCMYVRVRVRLRVCVEHDCILGQLIGYFRSVSEHRSRSSKQASKSVGYVGSKHRPGLGFIRFKYMPERVIAINKLYSRGTKMFSCSRGIRPCFGLSESTKGFGKGS